MEERKGGEVDEGERDSRWKGTRFVVSKNSDHVKLQKYENGFGF